MLTYGDGLSNVDLTALIKFHRSHGRIATVTAVRPSARFGDLSIVDNLVEHFKEKPQAGEGWINGGFFIFEPEIFDFIDNDLTILEKSPLERLAEMGELMAFKHHGYWQSMDTLREKESLQELWDSGEVPWQK
jgi:glucose-1-phosphate cytidylyltransferase